MSYWDTSALAKLYLPEPDSADFAQKAASDALMATARLTLYEMRRVAFRPWHGRVALRPPFSDRLPWKEQLEPRNTLKTRSSRGLLQPRCSPDG